MNHSFAKYQLPVHADTHHIDVIFADDDDPIFSRLGARGVGTTGIVGASAAVCNAAYRATGRRVRSLPVTCDQVMAP